MDDISRHHRSASYYEFVELNCVIRKGLREAAVLDLLVAPWPSQL